MKPNFYAKPVLIQTGDEVEAQICIPMKPLSVNAAWQGRRFKSKLYKRYEAEIAYFLTAPRGEGFGTEEHMAVWIKTRFNPKDKERTRFGIEGLVEINYIFHLKNWKMTDCDNLVKCLQDLIVDHGYIQDDRLIMRYVIEKIPSMVNGVEVKIRKFIK